MARPKKHQQTFTFPDMPGLLQDGNAFYDPRFMSADELAERLFAVDAYPECSKASYVKKNIELHIRRGNIPAVRLVPGRPNERIRPHHAPWGIPREAAEDWIRRATAESVARKERERQPS